MAHQDVVPVEPGTEKLWKQPPFDGKVVDGRIYGRGTLDDKSSLTAILDAVELLAAGRLRHLNEHSTLHLVMMKKWEEQVQLRLHRC